MIRSPFPNDEIEAQTEEATIDCGLPSTGQRTGVWASPQAVQPSDCPAAHALLLCSSSLARSIVSGLTRSPEAAHESNRSGPMSVSSPGKQGTFMYPRKLNHIAAEACNTCLICRRFSINESTILQPPLTAGVLRNVLPRWGHRHSLPLHCRAGPGQAGQAAPGQPESSAPRSCPDLPALSDSTVPSE